mmetsp:Transcript_16126/g.26470  ORF Transcript_16126/g.26470 Transcript_16126/m.26470 type:complete len:580 (-) Transcript_16126:59-1798(-)
MISAWLQQQQQSVRVIISKRVQNRCFAHSKGLQGKRSIGTSSLQTANLRLRHHQYRHIQQFYRCYGSQLKVELDPNPEEILATPATAPYLRTCLRTPTNNDNNSNNDNNHNNPQQDMEFAITFLGTGGGSPTMNRNGSCTALRLGGQTWLFDVCEGTHRQLQFTRISPMSINKIFISHLHGDHLYGIVPVIMGIMVAHKAHMNGVLMMKQRRREMQSRRRDRRNDNRRLIGVETGGEDLIMMEKPTLEIYGPPGLYNYIGMVLSLSCSKMNYLNVKVIELVGGKEERGFSSSGSSGSNQRGRRNVFTSHYPEIQTPLLTRKFLEQNDDRTWIIDAPEPVTADTPVVDSKNRDGFARLPNDTNLGTERRLHIKAAELDHLSRVQTFGYVVEEQPPPGTIDKDKAVALGVKPSRKYGLLKCGISVPNDDGTGEVHPSQVLSNVFRPRKFSLLADHRMVPPPMARLCTNSDIVVHEATLSKKLGGGTERIKARGHQNAYNAGRFAQISGCKVLALNHFGGTAFGESLMTDVLTEARDGNGGASEIVATYDFMEISVPRGGYDFDKKESSGTQLQSVQKPFSS